MSQAISNSMLFNLVITFVIVLIAFFMGSLSYSKASKVNNRIVDEIEKYGESAMELSADQAQAGIDSAYTDARKGIVNWLNKGDGDTGSSIGYRKSRNGLRSCPDADEIKSEKNVGTDNVVAMEEPTVSVENPYEYCVYRVKTCAKQDANDDSKSTGCYTYYKVRTYMYFDVPLIEDLIKIPVNGETRGFQPRNS